MHKEAFPRPLQRIAMQAARPTCNSAFGDSSDPHCSSAPKRPITADEAGLQDLIGPSVGRCGLGLEFAGFEPTCKLWPTDLRQRPNPGHAEEKI